MLHNIETERIKNNLTKKELANMLGVSLKTYYNWINGSCDIPSSALLKMSKLFETPIDRFLEEVNDEVYK